jgi:hypothetical protein
MTQPVSRRALASLAWILFQTNPCGICGGKSEIETDFSAGTSGFPCRHHKINAPYSFTRPLFHSFIHHRRYVIIIIIIIFSGTAAQRGLWPPLSRDFSITHNDASQSVGLLWTGDQPVAETSTWQHTTHTADKHPCPRWDSNPRSQQASGRRTKP